MCGRTVEDFSAGRDLFNIFASEVFQVGPRGAGTPMKLVVNLALELNRAVLAEALSFVAACALDPRQGLEILKAGASYSRVMEIRGAKT
jgi:2-hydroxy-3-oxopropionate reductase